MWSHIPSDLLSTIFSFLPPDSLARATSVCRHWHTCATAAAAIPSNYTIQPPWFLAVPARIRPGLPCFAHNPASSRWHKLYLDSVLSHPARPITTVSGLILLRLTSSTTLRLSVLNPFTRKSSQLPELLIPRTNPAVGLVELSHNGSPSPSPCPQFKIYVAGGMREGSAAYEPTMEMFDSWTNKWEPIGKIPVEYAVRLTVWTPNESALAEGVLYWMTSARAYSVMGTEIGTNRWMEQSVPMAERLEFAALVTRRGRLTVMGGESGMGACAWELCDCEGEQGWRVAGKVPSELGVRLVGREGNWVGVKCVGTEGAVWLYKGEGMMGRGGGGGGGGGGMVVWREVEGGDGEGRWEWSWVQGCGFLQGSNFPMKGFLLHPNISPL